MRCWVLLPVLVASFSTSLVAQQSGWPPSPGHTTLPLWPLAAPGANPNPAPETDTTTPNDRLVAGKPVIRLGNVSAPTLTLHTPTTKNTGAAIVVLPRWQLPYPGHGSGRH